MRHELAWIGQSFRWLKLRHGIELHRTLDTQLTSSWLLQVSKDANRVTANRRECVRESSTEACRRSKQCKDRVGQKPHTRCDQVHLWFVSQHSVICIVLYNLKQQNAYFP